MTCDICSYLQTKIREIVLRRGESIRWLAKQCGVDYSTIYRLQSGEQRRLSFINAKKILTVVEPEKAEAVLSDFYPREIKELGLKPGADDLAAILAEDLALYKIYAYAEIEGVTRDSIQEHFGKEGLQNLGKLLSLGILVEDGEGFKSSLEGRAYPPEAVIKKTAIHHFSMVSLNATGSIAENMRGGLTDEGIRELYDSVVEFREKALKIMSEKKGRNLVTVSMIAGPGELQ